MRRREPRTTRNSKFSSAHEALTFFRADSNPLATGKNKKQVKVLEKRKLAAEMRSLHQGKLEMLHKSLQMFFQIHFMADKRRRRNE